MVHWMITDGFGEDYGLFSAMFYFMLLSYVGYGIGTFIYSLRFIEHIFFLFLNSGNRIPERFSPGSFDIFVLKLKTFSLSHSSC